MTLDALPVSLPEPFPAPAAPATAGPVAAPRTTRRTVTLDDGAGTTGVEVAAIVVVREGPDLLTRCLAALAAQRRPPDRVILVDVGRQAVPDLPARALLTLGADAVVVHRPGADLGAAVAAAEQVLGEDGDAAWWWLLPDNAAPAAGALRALLAAVETAPSVAVAGCKQVAWDDGERLLDVGLTTTRLGGLVTGVERGEVDQGQQDRRTDVLAVSEPGLLVRRDLWRRLRGPLPGLTGARSALDLCRRARLAGHRVIVVPDAVVATGPARRGAPRRPGGRYRDDRHDALVLRLSEVSAPMVLPAVLWSVLALVVRVCGWLVLKRPARATDEAVALAGVLSRPDRLVRARWRQRATRVRPRRLLAPLRPGVREVLRCRRDEIAAWVVPSDPAPDVSTGSAPTGSAPAGSAPTGSAPTGPDVVVRTVGPAAAAPRRGRGADLVAALPVVLVALTAGVVGAWPLVRSGPASVIGPLLPPAPGSAAELWQLGQSAWRPVGLGHPGIADPVVSVLALLSYPFGGDPALLVVLLLVLAPALAAAAGWAAAGGLTRSWLLRGWAALMWAAWPPLLSAVQTGRVAAVLAHVALPLAAWALGRALARVSLAAAAGAGLALTVVLAGAPSLTVAVAVLLIVLTVLAPSLSDPALERPPRGRVLLPLVAALVPAGLLLPWWVAVARRPLLLLADPATGWTGAGVDPLPPSWLGSWPLTAGWETLARPAAALAARMPSSWRAGAADWPVGWPPAVLAAALVLPVLLVALLALVRRRRSGLAGLVAWLAVLAGTATAVVAQRSVVGTGRSWPGPGLSVAGLGLVTAAVVAAPAVRRRLGTRAWGVRQLVGVGLALVCLAGPLGALVAASWQGLQSADGHLGLVARRGDDVLPPVAVAEVEGPSGSRTLVLAAGGGTVRWNLARSVAPWWGSDSTVADARPAPRGGPDSAVVLPVIAGLLSDSGADPRSALTQLGVGSVLLTAPVDDTLTQALDAAPGLVRVGGIAHGVLWRVEPVVAGVRPSRVRITDAKGVTLTSVPVLPAGQAPDGQVVVDTDLAAGSAGRQLVLADRADAGWQADLDGHPLPRATAAAGWAQAWLLPAQGGHLSITYSSGWLARVGTARVVLALLAVLVALPLPRLRRRVAPPAPPRRTHAVPRAGNEDHALAPAPRIFDDEHPLDGQFEQLLTDPAPRRRARPAVDEPAGSAPGPTS